MKKILSIITMSILFLPGLNAQTLVQQASNASIVPNRLSPTTKHSVAITAETNQTSSGYNADVWENTYIHRGDTVTQGLGGLSCYYSVPQALRDVGYDSIKYWQSLQVRRSPTRGYRKQVRLYIVNTDSIPVSVGRAWANVNDPTGQPLGPGGAWQFFIETSNASKLSIINPPVDLTKYP